MIETALSSADSSWQPCSQREDVRRPPLCAGGDRGARARGRTPRARGGGSEAAGRASFGQSEELLAFFAQRFGDEETLPARADA
ncbi:MAG TPA: hypothetical protein VMN39_02250, partial [Longimicrobiaceae bacterium]|nr:hypothetical protein [Longimicrobiaceae bacterium]